MSDNKFLTVDQLIVLLQRAKLEHGGDVPIHFYRGDGYYEYAKVKDAYMEVIPASNVYPEDKQFVFKVGEDTDF